MGRRSLGFIHGAASNCCLINGKFYPWLEGKGTDYMYIDEEDDDMYYLFHDTLEETVRENSDQLVYQDISPLIQKARDLTAKINSVNKPWTPTIGVDAVTRQGDIVTCIAVNTDGTKYAFEGVHDNDLCTWKDNGCFLSSERRSGLDLVGDWLNHDFEGKEIL